MTSGIGEPNAIAIAFFGLFIVLSLGITVWASRRTRTADQFYAAGRSVTAFQNGLALAGDYMSAASFLGIAGLVAVSGFDGLIYSIGFLVGWPIVMFLIAEPLRNLGRYTFADVVAMRLRQTPIRIAAAIGGLAVIAFYLIAQMVGAGNLIRLLFGLPYEVHHPTLPVTYASVRGSDGFWKIFSVASNSTMRRWLLGSASMRSRLGSRRRHRMLRVRPSRAPPASRRLDISPS